MESDRQHDQTFLHDHQLQHQQKQMNSGLTRYQSAPSSYFSSFIDRDFCEDFLNRPSSPETERIFARLLSNTGGNTEKNISDQNLGIIKENSPVRVKIVEDEQQHQIMPPPNNQSGVMQQQQRNYSSGPQNYYQNQPQQNLQNQSSGSEMDYRTMSSVGMDRFSQMKMSGSAGNNSNLIRHSSSPAGLFNNINIENGVGDYDAGNNTNREASFSTERRPPTSSKPMSPISEIGNKTNNAGFSESHSNNFSTGFPMDSWDGSSMMSENISGVKRLGEDDRTISDLSAAETQNIDAGNRPPPRLAHHLSLPKDIKAIEKLMEFQDSVPCKIRAKRGCATHPRSIAERVRRTKISERMRKLQELVPNMDKQTNTADMLDLAVDYVKELQKQVKALANNQAKCTCSKEQLQQP